jgi:hypothetical protein
MRDGVAAETALHERDWPHGRNAMRTRGTVRRSGCDDDDRNEDADQDGSSQPRQPSPGYHRRPRCSEYPTVVTTKAPLRQVRGRDSPPLLGSG